MIKRNRCLVHIGLHKTGSTSLQHFLQKNRDRLASFGYIFFQGRHIPNNHVELHAATMRNDRTSTFKMKSGLVFDNEYRRETSDRLRYFRQCLGQNIAVFSAEGLSLLRHVDETNRLAAMLPAEVSIVVYLRNKADYLESHRKQIERLGITRSLDKTSNIYMESDTWLVDYELRLRAFCITFGREKIHTINYDEVCASDGSIIPSFLRLLNLDSEFGAADWQGIWLNSSSGS